MKTTGDKHKNFLRMIGAGGAGLRVLEIGRMQNEACKDSDGWSTKFFAEDGWIKTLVSIDRRPETEDLCRRLIRPEDVEKITFVNRPFDDAVKILTKTPFNLVYLDGNPNAEETCAQYDLLIRNGLIDDSTVIAIDDVRIDKEQKGPKGDLLIPRLIGQGYEVRFLRAGNVLQCYAVKT